MDPKISFGSSARKRRINHDAAVSLGLYIKTLFFSFSFVNINILE